MKRTILATIVSLLGSVGGQAADWRMYRADAASWCTCSYLNQATVALQPVE